MKVTGGQRIDLLGVKKEDLQNVWKDIGMPSGFAYAKSLRTVKTCVGSEWCRFGTQDSTQMGKDLEHALWAMYAPHKVKLAVSGCPRNCAEAGIKDVGVIGVDSGWEIYVAGNGGIKTEVAHFLVKVKTAEEVMEYAGAFLQLYREEGWYLERTVHYVGRVGLDHVKQRILEDPAGRQARSGTSCSSRSTARPIRGSNRTRRTWIRASSCRLRKRHRCRQRAKSLRHSVAQPALNRRDRHQEFEQLSQWTCRLRRRQTSPCSARAGSSGTTGIAVAVFRSADKPGIRPARSLPAQRRPAVAGHRVRHQRRVPAAQPGGRSG